MGFVSDTCKENNIKLVGISNLKAGSRAELERMAGGSTRGLGFTLKSDDIGPEPIIFYDDDTTQKAERNHIVLRELGHVLLGHMETESRLNFEEKKIEANVFAASLLAQFLYKEHEKETAAKARQGKRKHPKRRRK